MKLPNGHRADLGTKLVEYILNPQHRVGQHKARVFQSALGVTMANQSVLEEALKRAAELSEDAVSLGDNGFGEVYSMKFELRTSTGAAQIQSAWIIRHNEDFPRLTTCFIV